MSGAYPTNIQPEGEGIPEGFGGGAVHTHTCALSCTPHTLNTKSLGTDKVTLAVDRSTGPKAHRSCPAGECYH